MADFTGLYFDNNTLYWDAQTGAQEYEVSAENETNPGTWVVVYSGGTATSCPFNPGQDQFAIKGRTKEKDRWGQPSKPLPVPPKPPK